MLTLLTLFSLVGCGDEAKQVDETPKSAQVDKKAANPAKSAKENPSKSESSAASAQVDSKSATQAKDNESTLSEPKPELLDPASANETAPAKFSVLFQTTKGNFIIDVDRSWSPEGADRFYNLVKIGYFEDVAFFRAIKGFMVQFGIHGNPKVNAKWRSATIKDDPVKESNKRGYLTFAKTGAPNSRSTQFFINFGDNVNLDGMGFSPIGLVSETKEGGMTVVDKLYTGYGEGAPRGKGPNQMYVQTKGNPYLKDKFPKLDYINKAELIK